jgi:DNA-binding response OmpR family regulator
MNNVTILVVDDESMTLDIFEGYLIPEGFNLLLAKNGFKALEYMARNSVDLVVLDVMMPHMDGFTVCEHIKAKWKNVPVIMITAMWDKDQMQRGRDAGADGFLKKPIDKHELVLLIRSKIAEFSKSSNS